MVKKDDDFQKFLVKYLLVDIPSTYLENYSFLKEKLSKFEDFELHKNAYENYCNEKIKHYEKYRNN